MGLLDSITDGIKKAGIQAALDAAIGPINTKLEGIAKVKSLVLEGKHIKIQLILAGLEALPLETVCRSVVINDSGTKITLGDFEANKEFLANALNRFATRTFDVPDKFGLQAALRQARSVFA